MKFRHFQSLSALISLSALLIVMVMGVSCEKDDPVSGQTLMEDLKSPVPYALEIPEGFPAPFLDEDNPLTEQGVALGRMLFYDKILSEDQSMSCGSCHSQEFGFTDDGLKFSEGTQGIFGDRNSMAIINLAWMTDLFWDGRATSIFHQALGPVPNEIEMNLPWPEAEKRLNAHDTYPALFEAAFCTSVIDSNLVAKAITQFEMTMISGNSRYDKYLRRELNLTPQELNGLILFNTEGADCFHCHGNILFTDNLFHNNALDSVFTDLGLGKETGDPNDFGKFKTPTLRNIAVTGPYMHDGRFETLEEVIDHYSSGLVHSATADPLMVFLADGGVQMSPQEKADLLAFLHALTDEEFLTNEAFSDPFEN